MERLTIDYTLAMEDALGSRGLSRYLLEALRIPLGSARQNLERQRAEGALAWMDLPKRSVRDIFDYAVSQSGRFDNLVVLGIGGSALGTVSLATALLHPYHNLLPTSERNGYPRLFVLDNVDPDQTEDLFSHLDMRKTLVNVVSKSGTTAETMAAYLIVRRLLQDQVGPGKLAEHLVFTTDPEKGVLREIGKAENIRMFDIPPGVGGRFSVLSSVGLLPAALVGIDISLLLEGAALMDEWISEADLVRNPAYVYAALCFLHHTRFKRSISVMMPYSARLRDVADWYRQLWAESLGKAVDRGGAAVHAGMTPVKALGATDQHSQVQLYAEGPDDKLITFLRVRHFGSEITIPNAHPNVPALSYLAGHTMAELMNAEQKATAWALARRGRPSVTIELPSVNPGALGQLYFLLEVTTAIMGELYDINAFDQPGVELGKEATYALMGREGFEDLATEIEAGVPETTPYKIGGPQ
ncbi:MAG: glucose-6-phosphate isomerase [Thermoleophilia bacterium]